MDFGSLGKRVGPIDDQTIRRLEPCEDLDGGFEIATDLHGPEIDDVVCLDDSNPADDRCERARCSKE